MKPLTQLLVKDESFKLNEECLSAFCRFKEALISAPIIKASNQGLPFEVMCDASDYAMGAVLGQRKDNKPYVVYYTSRTLDDAQMNYATTNKEFLAVLFALKKFCPYLINFKVIILTDHDELKHLLKKSDSKPVSFTGCLFSKNLNWKFETRPDMKMQLRTTYLAWVPRPHK